MSKAKQRKLKVPFCKLAFFLKPGILPTEFFFFFYVFEHHLEQIIKILFNACATEIKTLFFLHLYSDFCLLSS